MPEELIGKVTHYFDKISVAAMKLERNLKVGDQIHLIGYGADFTQTVASMQMDGQNVESAATGDEVGLKVENKAKGGALIYLVKE